MLNIQKANSDNFDEIRNFYFELIDEMQFCEYKTAWQKGVYPSDKMLADAIENEELFFGTLNGKIIAAMILNNNFNEEYNQADWQVNAEKNEITVIHALGVMPSYSGNGYAKELVAYAQKYARNRQQKAVRLDVLKGNLPAEKLYTKAGFTFVEELEMFYEDTGFTSFKLYEYMI